MEDDPVAEVFRPVVGSAVYEVSDRGRVRNSLTGRLLKPYPAGRGYRVAYLSGIGKRYVHHLVLEAFVGPCPPGCETRHVNRNDPTDNRLTNLAWGTKQENAEDKRRHGTHATGSRVGNAKLTEGDVTEMRRLRESGVHRSEIAARFGLDESHVSRVILGRMWQTVPVESADRERLKRLGYVRGSRHHNTKVGDADREAVRREHRNGVATTELAKRYGVTPSTISRIVFGRKPPKKKSPIPTAIHGGAGGPQTPDGARTGEAA